MHSLETLLTLSAAAFALAMLGLAFDPPAAFLPDNPMLQLESSK